MSGVKKLVFALACIVSFSAMARNVYITPDADGTGDGTSWESPMMLTNYFDSGAANGDVVRLKSGYYYAQLTDNRLGVSKNSSIKISGGYAGTDDETLDSENPISELDFANSPTKGPYCPIILKSQSGHSVTFERLRFTRAKTTAIYKENSGDLILTDCEIVSNGWRNYTANTYYGGRGVRAQGGSFTATRCKIAYNGMYFGSGSTSTFSDDGYGIYLNGTTARLTDCKFIGNGVKITAEKPTASIRGVSRGMALFATGAKVYAERCDFVCNRAGLGSYDSKESNTAQGGIVVLGGNCDGSWFTNCSWVANQNLRDTKYNGNTYFGGALNLSLSSRSCAVSVNNCTFAYNITDSSNAASGIDVRAGTLNLRNSVFAGNSVRTGNTLGTDLVVRTNGTVNVEYCIFSSTNETNITVEKINEDKGELSFKGVIIGDACLATDVATAHSYVKTSTSKPYLIYDPSRIEEVLAFDVHLRSKAGRWTSEGYVSDRKTSPAIDAGDASLPYADEPSPNGFRLNLGRYGGTLEASLTHSGLVFRVR